LFLLPPTHTSTQPQTTDPHDASHPSCPPVHHLPPTLQIPTPPLHQPRCLKVSRTHTQTHTRSRPATPTTRREGGLGRGTRACTRRRAGPRELAAVASVRLRPHWRPPPVLRGGCAIGVTAGFAATTRRRRQIRTAGGPWARARPRDKTTRHGRTGLEESLAHATRPSSKGAASFSVSGKPVPPRRCPLLGLFLDPPSTCLDPRARPLPSATLSPSPHRALRYFQDPSPLTPLPPRRRQEGRQPLQDALRAVPHGRQGRRQQGRPAPARPLWPQVRHGPRLHVHGREPRQGRRVEGRLAL
jgi:hypothetical protein